MNPVLLIIIPLFNVFLNIVLCSDKNILDENDEFRIVNGTNAEEGEFPFAVSLRYQNRHTCGGTILNENFILTAAHCVCQSKSPRNASLYSIQYGVVNISEEPANTINVKKIYCHDFDSEKLIYDCAVLELSSTLPKSDKWKPVQISQDFVSDKDQTGTIIGWGRISHEGPISRTLQKLDVDIYDDKTCENSSRDSKHHICFGSTFGGACNGDSGTALLVDNIQVGIASFITDKCGIANKKKPNVYSKVASYYDWINNIALEKDKGDKDSNEIDEDRVGEEEEEEEADDREDFFSFLDFKHWM